MPLAQTRRRRAASVQAPPSQTLWQGLGGCLLPSSSPSARLGGNFCRRRRPAGGGSRRSKRPPSSPSARLGGKLIGPAWHRLPGCLLTRHAVRRTKSILNQSKIVLSVWRHSEPQTLNPKRKRKATRSNGFNSYTPSDPSQVALQLVQLYLQRSFPGCWLHSPALGLSNLG